MKHGIVAFGFVLLAGLLLSGDLDAGSLEPPGPPAPTMKTLSQVEARTPISSLPFTIAAPGSYYLTGDLTGIAGQPGIVISASFVTLDLNGFSLIGVPGSLEGIRANAIATEHFAIKNGVIRNWGGAGIAGSVATDVDAEDLRVDNNGGSGVVLGSRSLVRDTAASGNTGSGIDVGASSTVTGCRAGLNGQSGFIINSNGVVSSSTAMGNGNIGIALGFGSIATDCTAQQNPTGFNLALSSLVRHSTARQNTTGISAADGVSIEECHADANTGQGIRISNRSIVRGNLARGNTTDGIQATGNENRIEDNESAQNGVGIRVDGVNNLVVRNSVGSNGVEYMVVGGNKFGPVSIDPATAGPWANFDQ